MGTPRLWTLVPGDDVVSELPFVEAGPVLFREEVRVREDAITDADVEAVAFGLAKIKGEAAAYDADEPAVRLWFDEHARDLLVLVLGSSDREDPDG